MTVVDFFFDFFDDFGFFDFSEKALGPDASEKPFGSPTGVREGIWGRPGGVLGGPGGVLGRSWDDLAASWAPLGATWAPLGGPVGPLGRTWLHLGRLLGRLGRLEGVSWSLWGRLGVLLRARAGPLEASWGTLGGPLGPWSKKGKRKVQKSEKLEKGIVGFPPLWAN